MEMQQEYIRVHKSWRLNERSYGDLVGRNKKEVVKQFGKDQVKRWRRSYDEAPPPQDCNHPHWPGNDIRYRYMIHRIPWSESLKDTIHRTEVYWNRRISPSLQESKTLLIVAHENSLRSLLMRLENIPPEDIIHLNLPRAVPLAYRLSPDLKPLPRPDGGFDEATGMLRGEWLGGDEAVQRILNRDHRQVYDTNISDNLETLGSLEKWRKWFDLTMGGSDSHEIQNDIPRSKVA